jgi:hypothetical protein
MACLTMISWMCSMQVLTVEAGIPARRETSARYSSRDGEHEVDGGAGVELVEGHRGPADLAGGPVTPDWLLSRGSQRC